MPAPLDVDREQMRMLVLEVGVSEAARRTGVDLSTVKQWSARGKWLAHLREEPKLPESMQPKAVTGVTTPADALQLHLQECDNQSKAGYATASSTLSQKFAGMDADELLMVTPALKDGVTVADKVFGWTRNAQGSQQALVQIAIQGPLPVVEQPVQGQAMDVEH